MSQLESSIFTDLGVAPVINAAGPRTVMGGSRLSPAVAEAYQAANRHFVVMKDLQARSGEHLAQMLGSEMALVTSGCAAALSLAVAGIMSGTDRARIAQLPDTTGMKDEIVIQACQRYSYDRALTLCARAWSRPAARTASRRRNWKPPSRTERPRSTTWG